MKPVQTRKKFKIVAKPAKDDTKEFRLFDFQTFDTKRTDATTDRHFRIQMFGINTEGETCAIFVDDFEPFFYVKLPLHWRPDHALEWFENIKKQCKYAAKEILSCKMRWEIQIARLPARQ